MPERPMNPPPRIPIREFSTPSLGDGFYTERVDYSSPDYREIERGAKYADQLSADRIVIDQFPDLFFLKEIRDTRIYPYSTRIWATDRLSEDTYNSAVEYVSEAVPFPAFTRVYMARRDQYDSAPAETIGQPLDTLVAIKITDPGRGYTFAEFQLNPANADVEIEAIIDKANGGKILAAVVTNQGSGFTVAPEITIVGDGGDAKAIAIIQPQSAVLVQQKKSELPDDHPLRNEYVLVTRVYETLPGPWVISQKVDDEGIVVTVKKRRNIAANITVQETLVGSTWTQTTKDGQDNFVAEELNESRTVRTSGSSGPHLTTERVDEDGKTVTVAREMASQAYIDTISPRETISAGVWTRITSEAIRDLTAWLITETRPLPGNPVVSTKIDEDGKTISITKTLKDTSTITSQEVITGGNWVRTFKEAVSDLVANEVVESRPVPGNAVVSTKIDEDGKTITVTKTLKDTTTITSSESVAGGNWTRTYKEEVSDLVANEIIEARPIPGNSIETVRLDEDGVSVNIEKTLKILGTITTGETLITGVWTKKTIEPVSDLVGREVVETRNIPGNPIVEDKIDEDGKDIDSVRTLKGFSSITPGEVISAGVWKKTESRALTELVSWEVVTARPVPGNAIPSANIGPDDEIATITRTLKDTSSITPSATESAGVITTVEKKEVSDLVSNEIRTQKPWLDEALYSVSIPNVIPESFRAQIPLTTVSHIVAGTAAQPTLGTLEFQRSERQLTKLLKEVRVESLGAVVLPITFTNKELTTQFGGGILNATLTLEYTGSGAVVQGFRVIDSRITQIGNGLEILETKQLPSTQSWPELSSRLWDENMRLEYDETQQVVPAGTSEDANPDPYPSGLIFAWVSEVKAIDDWRSRKTNISKPAPTYLDEASALVQYDFRPYKFPGLLTLATFGYYVRESYAQLVRHTIKTWWVYSVGPPTVAIDDIITDNIIISTLNDVTTLAYSGEVLHDDLFTFITLFWPATTPSYTDYIASWQGNERAIAATITPERETNVWKVQTRSVVMR